MTETLSLICVVVMALLLWRERRAHKRTWAMLKTEREESKLFEYGYTTVKEQFAALQAEHLRWSDRDKKGRFVKRERGSSI